ncbi:hypothetical protein HMPREF0880_01868 [Yokenella regensburgei ATCC 43003]|nr:hypothetical protein HMPREF0880_01868 [Yokenella regensburgei ATCC 43003]
MTKRLPPMIIQHCWHFFFLLFPIWNQYGAGNKKASARLAFILLT